MKVASRIEKKKDTPSDIVALISTARANNCWIYFEKNKKFFTPDELQESWEAYYDVTKRSSNFSDFKIVTPLYAVRLVAQWTDIANAKQQEVLKKLEGYTTDFKVKK